MELVPGVCAGVVCPGVGEQSIAAGKSAEENDLAGGGVINHRGVTACGRQGAGRSEVLPCMCCRVVLPGVVEPLAAVIASEEATEKDQLASGGVVDHRCTPAGVRAAGGLELVPLVGGGPIGPCVVKGTAASPPAEEDDFAGCRVVDH